LLLYYICTDKKPKLSLGSLAVLPHSRLANNISDCCYK